MVFPGVPVVKNLPSNAGNTGSIPGQGTRIPHGAGQQPACLKYELTWRSQIIFKKQTKNTEQYIVYILKAFVLGVG